jgi:proline iminopeptidase
VALSDGAHLFVREAGPASGPLTIYLHGGPGGTMTDGGYEMEELLPGRRLVMYDQRGGGRSDPAAPATLTAARHVEDLEELRRHLGEEKVSLIGLSWGSALAAMYAAKYPRHVARIVFLSPMPVAKVPFDAERWKSVGRLPPENATRRAELERAMERASGAELVRLCKERFALGLYARYVADPRSLERARRCLDDAQIRSVRIARNNTMAMLGDWDYRPMLATLAMPALVIEGAQTITTLTSPREWAAAMPNARLLLFESAGHANWLDQPGKFSRAVGTFLDGRFPE